VEVKTTLEEEMVKLVWVHSVNDIRNTDLYRRSNWRSFESIRQLAEDIDYVGGGRTDRWVGL